jgi:outer membrane protein TolC
LVARRSQSPEVLEARADRQAMAARRRLARGGYAPMITLGAAYEHRLFGMPDSFGTMVSLSLPIWAFDNQKKQVDLATAMVRRTEQQIRSADALIGAEVRMAWSRARASERRLDVLEDEAIPRMNQTLEASEAAYVSGTGDFLAVLDSTLALQGLEEQRIDAIVALHVARFEVERVLGGTHGRERQ